MYCKLKYRAILFENNLVHYSVLFNFGHIRRWDQCAVFILYTVKKTCLLRGSLAYIFSGLLVNMQQVKSKKKLSSHQNFLCTGGK